MRRIIRDKNNTNIDESEIQKSLFSQLDDKHSSIQIASSEIVNSMKLVSRGMNNFLSDLDRKLLRGFDKLISNIDNKSSIFSYSKNNRELSSTGGSWIGVSSSANKDNKPVRVKNEFPESLDSKYIQTLSFLSSPKGRKPLNNQKDRIISNISSNIEKIKKLERRKNNTLGKILKFLRDDFSDIINQRYARGENNGLNLEVDIPGKNPLKRNGSKTRSVTSKETIKAARGASKFGLGRVAGMAARGLGILGTAGLALSAYEAAHETVEQAQNDPKKMDQLKKDLGNASNVMYQDPSESFSSPLESKHTQKKQDSDSNTSDIIPKYSSSDIVFTEQAQNDPKKMDQLKKDLGNASNRTVKNELVNSELVSSEKTDKVPPMSTSQDISDNAAHEYSKNNIEEHNKITLIQDGVNTLHEIRRILERKKSNEALDEIQDNLTINKSSDNSDYASDSTPSNTSTGMSGSSISDNSPYGVPTNTTLPIEENTSNNSVGEPGIDERGTSTQSNEDNANNNNGGNTTVQGYLSIMQKNAQGSRYSQTMRNKENYYDCSSFVSRSLKEAGFNISPSNTTATLPNALSKIGFSYTPLKIPAGATKAPNELQAGDILLNPGHHVETYAGNNRIVGAHSSSSGVSLKNFYSTGYPGFWRLGGGSVSTNSSTNENPSTSSMSPSGGFNAATTRGDTSINSSNYTSSGSITSIGGFNSSSNTNYSNSNQPELGEPGLSENPLRATQTKQRELSIPSTTNKSTSGMSGPSKNFGSLLSKYETGGRGTSQITNSAGDSGGASYGKFQLSHKKGSLKEFMSTLQREDPQAFQQLAPLWNTAGQGGSGAFGQKWKELASQGRLQKSEESYARNNYMKGGMSKLKDKALIERINANPALQEVFLSTTVQHGASGGASIWNKAASSSMSDEDIIKSIYSERGRKNANGSLAHFSRNSASIQRGVAKRFSNEVNDALALNAQFKSGNYTGEVPGGTSRYSDSGGRLNTSPQSMDPNIGRFSPSQSSINDASMFGQTGSGGDSGGTSSGGGGAGSEIPSYINDITLMALQTQLMYDQ